MWLNVVSGSLGQEGALMQLSSASVLIVDDEPQVCSLIRDGLARDGLRCVTVTEPQQAKQSLDREQFAVMVADISMPHVSGLDLLAYAKKTIPACKVILITGVSSAQYLTEALSLGAFDYLQKPFDLNQLTETVRKAIRDDSNSCSLLSTKAARAMQTESLLKETSLEGIRALVHAVEAKDPYTRRHSEQVAHYAVNLAWQVGLLPAQVESIRLAALVHDVGKIGVPDNILTKAAPLTDEEFEHIRRHPVVGSEILKNLSTFAAEVELVRHHHENWDGTGYPDGLAGDQIPRGARVINIADSMDAMLMHRTYKRSYSPEEMLAELIRCTGTQFDPDLAAAAVNWCRVCPNELIIPKQVA